MRIGEVIGTMTLNQVHPSLVGMRWLIVVPCSLKSLQTDFRGDGEELVVLDQLGAGIGDQIGFSEGAEAAAPFSPSKKPVDAYCGCILDTVVVSESASFN